MEKQPFREVYRAPPVIETILIKRGPSARARARAFYAGTHGSSSYDFLVAIVAVTRAEKRLHAFVTTRRYQFNDNARLFRLLIGSSRPSVSLGRNVQIH